MGLFSSLFKRGSQESKAVVAVPQVDENLKKVVEEKVEEVILDLPQGEIVNIVDGVLDVESSECKQKFMHNLEVLIRKAKRDGKIDKFKLIREDDNFPRGLEWEVLSKNTLMERVCTSLSLGVKKRYALEKKGVKTTMNGFSLPVDEKVVSDALKDVDKYFGSVYLPAHFRSTKHFTVNTPLGFTGDYNNVSTDRNFIVIDDIDNFLKSGFGYSVAYHDAYLDVSHKSLPVSRNALVLIEESKYEKIKDDKELMSDLSKLRVVKFRGDESIAIAMVLTEMGVLPSQIGFKYATYDNELREILDSSIRNLATDNNLLFDRSHGGGLTGNTGHFTSNFDDKNVDYNRGVEELAEFLREKIPECSDIITSRTIMMGGYTDSIIDRVGLDRVIATIDEFNLMTMEKFNNRYREYKKDRESMTPEIEEIFKNTIRLIDNFYMNGEQFDSMEDKYKVEEMIRIFLQGDTVREQLSAAKSIIAYINSKGLNVEEVSNQVGFKK